MKKRIHLMGIGGVGMSALAILLKEQGHIISGCDLHLSQRTRWLEDNGIKVFLGHDISHVKEIDEFIITPAVPIDNPERVVAKNTRFRGDVLAEIVNSTDSVAVCGSHGKTTTSTFVAKLLLALGENVSWAIGGETGAFPVAGSKGDGKKVLVVEADESDGTLANYHARTLLITNCEYDHPDFFKTEEDYFACFEKAKNNAEIIIESEKLAPIPDLTPILAPLPPHNRANARAAVEVALSRSHKIEDIIKVLPNVINELPDRRFQQIFPEKGKLGARVITDYAHHPTEIRCAIQMARKICSGSLRVLFQPHRYSRTKSLLTSFPQAFEEADELILLPTYSAFEKEILGGTTADLYAECRKKRDVLLARSCEEAWEHARLEMKENDITLLLGAGDIISLVSRVKKDMELGLKCDLPRTKLNNLSFFRTGGASVGGGTRIVVGCGSNLWISDLTTTNEYYRLKVKENNSENIFCASTIGGKLGISWMTGIPGTLGGWVKMNAGAFNHSISELISRVKIDGNWVSNIAFSYRTSNITGIIEEVEFDLQKLTRARNDKTPYNRKTFPARCCGSVFKNPPNLFAGRLLEDVGAKEISVGGAFVWREHANVIFTDESATSSDVLALTQILQSRVLHKFGIYLEPEICGLK